MQYEMQVHISRMSDNRKEIIPVVTCGFAFALVFAAFTVTSQANVRKLLKSFHI